MNIENPYESPHTEFPVPKSPGFLRSLLFIPIGFVSTFLCITLIFIVFGVFNAAQVNVSGTLKLSLLSFLSTLPLYPVRNASRFIHVFAPPFICFILVFLGMHFFP